MTNESPKKPIILIIEDYESIFNFYKIKLKMLLGEKYQVLIAPDLETAERTFDENKGRIVIISFDGEVPKSSKGMETTTLALAKRVVFEGFQPEKLIAVSSSVDLQAILTQIGCGHHCDNKVNLPEMIRDILAG